MSRPVFIEAPSSYVQSEVVQGRRVVASCGDVTDDSFVCVSAALWAGEVLVTPTLPLCPISALMDGDVSTRRSDNRALGSDCWRWK